MEMPRLQNLSPYPPRERGDGGRTGTPDHTDSKALASLIAGALCIGFAPIFVRLIDVGVLARRPLCAGFGAAVVFSAKARF